MHKLLHLAGWGCVILLAFLSWLPATVLIRTGADGRIEHFIAYMGTTICVTAAYRARLGLRCLVALLVGYAGILELGQNFAPGRHPSFIDFTASSLGVIVGAAAFQIAHQLLQQRCSGRR